MSLQEDGQAHSEDFIAECFAKMSPAAAMMDTGYGNLLQKQSELHKEKTVEVRNVVRCVVLSETKKRGWMLVCKH